MNHRFLGLVAIACAVASLTGVTVASGSALVNHAGAGAKTWHVKIVTDPKTVGAYKPPTITVHRGQRIVFKNSSNAIHTVTDRKGSFDSKNIGIGHSWTYTAKRVRTFSYYCIYHLLMKGKIIVKP